MIKYQRNGKTTYEGNRIYLDTDKIGEYGFVPGTRFDTVYLPEKHELTFVPSDSGENAVSRKKRGDKIIPVIDKAGKNIKECLAECDSILISIVEQDGEHRLVIKGEKNTASVQNEQTGPRKKRTISFCAGAGISAAAMAEAGFEEVAGVEFDPKGTEDGFANMYHTNHPDAVLFNVSMSELKGTDLPEADVWSCTLDCTDFSKASHGTNKLSQTKHLFVHMMRLFWEREKSSRPNTILIENVPEFKKTAGDMVRLLLEEEGFRVTEDTMNSLDFGGRTQRKRYFLVASSLGSFEFPEPTGKPDTSLIDGGVLTLDELEWITPEDSKTLHYFIEREKQGMKHNHKMTLFDPSKDAHVGTITKNHAKIQPENWLKHPTEDKYAYMKGAHVRKLQGVPDSLFLGKSNKAVTEAVGQSVCYRTFRCIASALSNFIENATTKLDSLFDLNLEENAAEPQQLSLF